MAGFFHYTSFLFEYHLLQQHFELPYSLLMCTSSNEIESLHSKKLEVDLTQNGLRTSVAGSTLPPTFTTVYRVTAFV